MDSGKAAKNQGRSPRKGKEPVDIALDAGMRPMLIGHGFQRRSKRYFVRETPGAVQYVAISPPDPREGYLTCLYAASAGIVSKEITNISRELDLRGSLSIHIKHTDHVCHAECQLEDINRFNARDDIDKINRTPFFLRPFVRIPRIYDYIPEMKQFGILCRKIDTSFSSIPGPELADTYAIQHAQLTEKYILPWFDQCAEMEYLVQWIEYWVGKRSKSKNLLLATACCLASDFEGAKAIFKRAVEQGNVSMEKIYRQELRHENKIRFCKTTEARKRRARKVSETIMKMKKQTAEDARTLARYFDIDLS